MNKKIISIFLSIIIPFGFALSVSSQNEDELDLFHENDTAAKKEELPRNLAFFVIDPPKDYTPHFTGDPIQISWEFSAVEGAAESAFLIFVDGQSEAAEAQLSPLHIFRLPKDESREITVEFTPAAGHTSESVGVFFAAVATPSFLPESADRPYYGENNWTMNTLAWNLVFDADVPAEAPADDSVDAAFSPIPDPEPGSDLSVYDDYMLQYAYFDMTAPDGDESEFDPVLTAKNGRVPLKIVKYGGETAEYRVTVFLNHEPIPIDGKPSLSFPVEYGKTSTLEFGIDIADTPKLNTLYAIAVPLGPHEFVHDHYVSFAKSRSVLAVNDLVVEEIGRAHV